MERNLTISWQGGGRGGGGIANIFRSSGVRVAGLSSGALTAFLLSLAPAWAQGSITSTIQGSLDPAASDVTESLLWGIAIVAVVVLLGCLIWMVIATDKMKVVRYMLLILVAVGLSGLATRIPAVVQAVTGGG